VSTAAMHVWKTGDLVRITYEGRSVDGAVKLASPNGLSLMLEFDAILGGCVGMMPVLYEGGQFICLLNYDVRRPVFLVARVEA
jgi:hypothetical protein